jgi:hypothetical protein
MSFSAALRAIARHRGVQAAVALWVAGTAAVLLLAHGSLPFDRPAVSGLPVTIQVAGPSIAMVEIIVLMIVTFVMTRTREIPDMAARAPDRAVAARETIGMLGYAALGQAGGWVVGPGARVPRVRLEPASGADRRSIRRGMPRSR